ncbi:hypothetical protein TEH11_1717 [Tetragenococcus halophilus subsp. halophilus]|uniref:helix-turn-helix domain-containing protein n=2 Tax=Tetragenococcus halophilus TaxID=51669 RepID=UPI000CBDC022|nr:hypothetical protein TEH11_1717 [Tetragenococcus halophilus subsp. halophilus]
MTTGDIVKEKGKKTMQLGEQLKYLRQIKNLGVNQLALKAGLKGSQISRLENGESQNPNFHTIKVLANALGVSLAYFDDMSENKAKSEITAHLWEDISDEQLIEITRFIDYVKARDE